jgi:MoxR-like ATPase
MTGGAMRIESPNMVKALLVEHDYLTDDNLAVAVYLASVLEQPLLLEGQPGVGKTEVAAMFARATGAELIRLQCYEGIDVHQALYDWDFARQMLEVHAAELGRPPVAIYDERFLIRRPLLKALQSKGPVVLLIDEIDRADEEFEAFLLELLSDFAVTVPELGTIRAHERPLVFLTSNRTRELHDALKRRCLYHWIDHPTPERELAIVRAKLPEVPMELAERVCAAVAQLRGRDLYKEPGVGETIAWVRALLALGPDIELTAAIGAVLKVREDIEAVIRDSVLTDA